MRRAPVTSAFKRLNFRAQYSSGISGPSIHRICLTGGPCGGKSTAMVILTERLQDAGFAVYRVPEAATLMIGGGIDFTGDMAPEHRIQAQVQLMTIQATMEDAFIENAKASGKPSIVLCDRGLLDSKAYMTQDSWREALSRLRWDEDEIRETRYDSVLFMSTAANGAEEFYTTLNNNARSESPDLAREIDRRLQRAYVGTNLSIIDNSTNFNTKIRRTVDSMCESVGLARTGEVFRKFLLHQNVDNIPVDVHRCYFDEVYLSTKSTLHRNRLRRSQPADGGVFSYHLREKHIRGDGMSTSVRRVLNGREFATLRRQARPSHHKIRKERRTFIWEDQYFRLDTWIHPKPGLTTLKVEAAVNRELRLPPFLEIEREVSGIDEFDSFRLCMKLAGENLR